MRRFTVIGGEESVSNRLIKYLKEELKLAQSIKNIVNKRLI